MIRSAALAAAPAATQPLKADNPLLKRLVDTDPGLRSYQADVKLDVAMKSFPYLSPTLTGTAYYARPDRHAIVFNTVPALAEQFKKVYPNVDPPSTWLATYDASILGDAAGTTTFRLVPKHAARVDHLDVAVDDAAATIRGYTWTYKDGGSVAISQTFVTVSGRSVVGSQTGHIELPSYRADVASTFTNYKINAPVPPGVFEGK